MYLCTYIYTHEPRTLRSNLYLFEKFPRLLSIYNPAHCVSTLWSEFFLPPIYCNVRGLCVYEVFIVLNSIGLKLGYVVGI